MSGGKKISIKNLAFKFKKVFGDEKTLIVLRKKRLGDITKARADLSKIKKLLNFKPRVNVDDGLIKIKKKILQYDLWS